MTEATKPKSGWLNLVVDYGPIVIFFAVYRYYLPSADGDPVGQMLAVVKSTGAFMVAAVIALVVSKWKLKHVSPMLWLSAVLVVGFGALTVYFNDESFIQIKPTAIYLLFGLALLIGAWRGKALLKILLEAAFEGLSDQGWLKLSRNWGVFFLCLAGLNEGLRAQLDFEGWLWAKLWVFLPLTFLFTFSQIPMLLKHGLSFEDKDEPLKNEPPTGS